MKRSKKAGIGFILLLIGIALWIWYRVDLGKTGDLVGNIQTARAFGGCVLVAIGCYMIRNS